MTEIDRYRLERAMDDSVTRYMNALAPELPPLHWSFNSIGEQTLSGLVAVEEYPDAAGVVAQWRDTLGLAPGRDLDGFHECAGTSGGLDVRVWYITDRDEFDGKT